MSTFLENHDFQLVTLIVALFIIPKFFIRFKIPAAITAILLGFLFRNFLGWFENDPMINQFAALGITSLFLFAGLEVNFKDLKSHRAFLVRHIFLALAIFFASSYLFYIILE